MKEGGTWEGKRSGGWEKANRKRRNGKSTYMDGMRPSYFGASLSEPHTSVTALLDSCVCMYDCAWPYTKN